MQCFSPHIKHWFPRRKRIIKNKEANSDQINKEIHFWQFAVRAHVFPSCIWFLSITVLATLIPGNRELSFELKKGKTYQAFRGISDSTSGNEATQSPMYLSGHHPALTEHLLCPNHFDRHHGRWQQSLFRRHRVSYTCSYQIMSLKWCCCPLSYTTFNVLLPRHRKAEGWVTNVWYNNSEM